MRCGVHGSSHARRCLLQRRTWYALAAFQWQRSSQTIIVLLPQCKQLTLQSWLALLLATLVTTYMNCSTRPLIHASSGTAKVFCTSASLNTFNSQSLVSSLVSLVIRAMCTSSSWSLDNNGGSLQNSSSEHFTVVCSVKRTPPAPPASILDLAWHHKPTRYCVPSPALRGERAEE